MSKLNHTIHVVTDHDNFFYYKLRRVLQITTTILQITTEHRVFLCVFVCLFFFFPNGMSGIYLAHSRTAAETDQIPYWIWKELTEIVTPLASPESGFSESPLSVCHHCGSERLSRPSPKWMSMSSQVTSNQVNFYLNSHRIIIINTN